MEFEFATATRIVFGCGAANRIGEFAARAGRRVLLVTGTSRQRFDPIVSQLESAGCDVVRVQVTGEPTIQRVTDAVCVARETARELVVGVGGGSVLDTAKAVGVLVTNTGPPLDYLEVIGHGRPLTRPSLPVIVAPTTAGTGSEVTRNAVLGVPEQRVKVSLRSPLMLPRLALIDPQLTLSMPSHLTAYTGLDALTQVLEPFVSRRANPMTDALCREGIRRATKSLASAVADGTDLPARTDMSLASLFGGLSLANAKLGAVHGIAGPFGGMFTAPHGAVCAALLPHVVEVNIRGLQDSGARTELLTRYREFAQIATGQSNATLDDGITWLHDLCHDLPVPPLRQYGFQRSDFSVLIEKALRSSSMQGNPVELSDQQLSTILDKAY